MAGAGGGGDGVGIGIHLDRRGRQAVGDRRVLEAVARDRDDEPVAPHVPAQHRGDAGGGRGLAEQALLRGERAPGGDELVVVGRDDAGARDVAVEEVVIGPVAAAYGVRLANAG